MYLKLYAIVIKKSDFTKTSAAWKKYFNLTKQPFNFYCFSQFCSYLFTASKWHRHPSPSFNSFQCNVHLYFCLFASFSFSFPSFCSCYVHYFLIRRFSLEFFSLLSVLSNLSCCYSSISLKSHFSALVALGRPFPFEKERFSLSKRVVSFSFYVIFKTSKSQILAIMFF